MIVTDQPSVIWRFDLPTEALDQDVALDIRERARLLFVDQSARTGVAALWFLIPEAAMREGETDKRRLFRVVGTGQPIPAGYQYHGTTGEGRLVWHVFEKVEA